MLSRKIEKNSVAVYRERSKMDNNNGNECYSGKLKNETSSYIAILFAVSSSCLTFPTRKMNNFVQSYYNNYTKLIHIKLRSSQCKRLLLLKMLKYDEKKKRGFSGVGGGSCGGVASCYISSVWK